MSTELVRGDRGDSVLLVTNTLVRLGLLNIATENFDEKVEEAIKAFQQGRGITATGIINPVTARMLEEARWKLGDRILSSSTGALMHGDDVTSLQTRLIEMGFNCGKIDGIYGVSTESAVKEFQKSAGLPVDGKFGPATLIALMRLVKTVSGGAPAQLREHTYHAQRGPALANKVIVLDPSWGGEFTGEVGFGVIESETMFDIAQRLEGRLIALGVSVYLTRSAKNSPLENQRIQFTNSVNPDLVIALKVDKYKNETANGVATYYYGSTTHGIHSVIGEKFANLVQREICARTEFQNCRTHPKSWDLLRLIKAPVVRIDFGYLSNPKDAKLLAELKTREQIVESIVIAIQRLYLSAEEDAKTGTLRISDLRRAGIRK